MPTVSADPAVSQYAALFEKIETLQAKAASLLEQIQSIYAQIGSAASAVSGGPARGRAAVRPSRGAPRAPRGALKEAVRRILAGGKPVRPAEIVRQLPKVGFQSASTPRVLYTNVYLTMKRDKTIQKTAEGFKLKAGGKK